MQKRLLTIAVLGLALTLGLSACAGGSAAQTVPTVPGGTIVGATSAVPTSTSAPSTGNLLPSGTLILMQKNQPIALPPNGKPISLTAERFGLQASGNGKVGVRFDNTNGVIALTLVDNSNGQTRPIPQATGLSSPTITWKNDGTGFAFFDFGQPGKTGPNTGAILYYDVATNSTKVLIPPPGNGQVAASIAWSPDGRFLLYSVSKVGAEGIGGPDSKPFLFDSASGKSTALPQDANGFNQWDRTGKGFLAQRGDIASGASQIEYFSLDALNNPKVLTPANTLDFLADVSPDGKRIVVSSSPAGKNAQVANLYTMNLDGSSRKVITDFKAADQAITALVWGTDGIYYSLSGANSDTTWRVDLDGKNARQVALGTLVDIVGSH